MKTKKTGGLERQTDYIDSTRCEKVCLNGMERKSEHTRYLDRQTLFRIECRVTRKNICEKSKTSVR